MNVIKPFYYVPQVLAVIKIVLIVECVHTVKSNEVISLLGKYISFRKEHSI